MTDQTSAVGSVVEAFSHATSVRAGAGGTVEADVSGEWAIVGRPNGGYLLALLGRAALSLTDSGHGHVVAASAHYLRPPDFGPVEIEGEVLRQGRSISQVRTRMSQGGRACVEALISMGQLDPTATPRWDAGVPDVPEAPIDDCTRVPSATPDGVRVPIYDQVDALLDPETSGILRGRPSGRGELRGWLRFLSGESFDPVSLLYAVDAFPPTTFDIDFTWGSTVELTAYVRAVPAPGPVRVACRTRLLDRQWVDQTCDVWDGSGRLVAQATQLAVVLGG